METNDFIDLCMQAYFALIQVFAHNISRQRDLIQTVIEDFCILLDEVVALQSTIKSICIVFRLPSSN